MAKKQFDRGDVLDRAIDLFWHHGFNGSSMQQVTKYTGLKPGSIYNEFGSKEALFSEALKRYAENSQARIKATIEKAPSVEEGICNLLDYVVKDSEKKEYCSCLLIKTQLELASSCSALQVLAGEMLQANEKIIRCYLEQKYDSELSRARAASVMVHIFGIRVYGYRQSSSEMQHIALKKGLSWLPW